MAEIPSTLSSILAKSNPHQTLVEHSLEAVNHLGRFLTAFSHEVKRVAEMANVSQGELESRMFAAVWLHDIGKASRAFQSRIMGRSDAVGVYHPLLSVPFAIVAAPPIGGIHYEALAVMSHHSPYYGGLYGDIDANMGTSYIWDATTEFYRMLPSEHLQLFGHEYPFPIMPPTDTNSRSLIASLRDVVSDYPPARARDIFGLFTSAVHYSDWLSSGHYARWSYTLPNLTDRVAASIQERREVLTESFAHRVAPGIQSRAAAVKGHILLTAPTGSGKTEAALLWAGSKVHNTSRLTYFLPTRVTSNSIFDRIRNYAGDLTGLAHGTAGLVIGEKDGYDSETFRSRLFHSTFMQPATVATVDQILLARFNWSHWGLVETSTSQSAIIFDEIHAYDIYTLGLILNASREFARRGAHLCFMSATMPEFVKEAVGRLLQPFGGYESVDCPEAEREQRHTIFPRRGALKDALSDIESSFSQGQKVLVIVNTVDEARNMYCLIRDKIGKENVMLFHSRFIERDRGKLEALIIKGSQREGGFVAVVTQIVEVSLDIDYDVLFTQICPIDALAQRLGRINRKGTKGLVPAYVYCEPNEGSSSVYGAEALDLASRLLVDIAPGSAVRQGHIADWVELQYPKDKWLEAALNAEQEAEKNLRALHRMLWQIQTLRFSNETEAFWRLAQSRKEQFPTLEVVPEYFRKDLTLCKHPTDRQSYIVRVPAYMITQKTYDRDFGVLFADIGYDSILGAYKLNG